MMNANLERRGVGALIGVLSAAVALGVGEITAAFVRPASSPVIAVGNRFILLTPESVKRWAIRSFGTDDKHVLLTGIFIGVAVFAVIVGVLALRRIAYGLVGLGLFGAIGVYCALSANASQWGDVVPTILGTLAASAAMVYLVRSAAGNRVSSESAAPLLADRRRFLQGGAAAAGLAAVGGFGGRAAQRARFDVSAARAKVVLPSAGGRSNPNSVAANRTLLAGAKSADLGKSPVPWTTPNRSFYRIDTALSVPQIDPKKWSLRIHGRLDKPITLTYQELLARPLIERWVTLCCVSNEVGGNLIGNARWLGAPLADLLREAGVHPDADQLVLSSSDGMTIGAPTAVVMDGRDAMIAVGMNGEPLPIEHGFPARVVVPGLYGYVSACKWVVDIEATTYSTRQAYWVAGGWAAKPEIRLESRIDTPRSGASLSAGSPVAIAGVAWDQHVGVSAVEVQVNGGGWQPARLAPVPSTDTWRQWVLPWTPPTPGSYTLQVRATDMAGRPQVTKAENPFPSGATGLHAVTVRAR